MLQAAAERAAEASRLVNEEKEDGFHSETGDEDVDVDEDEKLEDEGTEDEGDEGDVEMPEAGPSTTIPQDEIVQGKSNEADQEASQEEQPLEAQPTISQAPPRILITTSPAPCKDTYAFCEDLKNIFPGGEFFKRPKGRGFEVGRVVRWGAKRGFGAMIVVNEDHKKPSELINEICLEMADALVKFRCHHADNPSCWSHCVF